MIVKLTGGLGNQLFCAAFGFSVAKARGDQVFFDKSGYENETLRHYELDAYDLDMKFKKSVGFIYKEKSALFDPDVYVSHNTPYLDTTFEGYWQNEKYFDRELVYNLFRLPKGQPNEATLAMARKIDACPDSCFIGVRRADYLWPERINYHGVMEQQYYIEALRLLPKDTRFFVFTDDIRWATDYLCNFDAIVDVNGPNEKHWDIWLMSLCTHAILANSTFHWWGCFLGADRHGGTVIAPKRWFADEKVNAECQIVPSRWIRI